MGEPTLDVPQRGLSAAPSPRLRALLGEYHVYRAEPRPDGVHRGLPSGTLTLVITLDTPVTMLDTGRNLDALVGGMHTRPALMSWPRIQTGIQLDPTPLGCRLLFGMPAGELSGAVLSLEELWGWRGAELVDRLRELASSPRARARVLLDALDAALTDRLDDCRLDGGERGEVAPEVREAWRQLEASGGRRRIASLADEVGWSRRHLGAQFSREIGLSPQTAARVLRFDRARRNLPDHPLASVAADHGYADQSHLTREFHAFAGVSPTTWMAEEGLAVKNGAPIRSRRGGG